MAQTPFQIALQESLEKTGHVRTAMEPLGEDFEITRPDDARALAVAVRSVAAKSPPLKFMSPIYEFTRLMEKARSQEAFDLLRAEAMPALEKLFDRQFGAEGVRGQDLAPLLMLFADYSRREGFERIARSIESGLDCEWWWTGVFRRFHSKHPHVHDHVHDLLGIPLQHYPRTFVRVALLDHATGLAIQHGFKIHPFDSPDGKEQLKQWLTDSDPANFSKAQSAAAALPFISNPERSDLLALAMDHLSRDVQLEAAWASAKLGNAGGITVLARACTDPASFVRASAYLEELGRRDAIPSSCDDADFLAEAHARSWLEHPNEFGRQPDRIILFDARTLFWPPANEERRVHLFHYTYDSDQSGKAETTGVVMTGGRTTFSLFSTTTTEMPAEDVYAIHCCWELQMNKDSRAPKERTAQAGRALLGFTSHG
jgi:hypothetical protein